ncbi:MAG: DUF6262 family protein [Candidatus Omnitrophica bacterium]|nr:DUF6262 family protein [Candidatus Omnitrophota bacterium]
MSKKTDRMLETARDRTATAESKVMKAIDEIRQSGGDITFYGVYTKAGVSKSFIYNNKTIRTLIEKERGKGTAKQSQDAKATIIELQRRRIKELEAMVKKLQQFERYKDKCAVLKSENANLKRQLEIAYKY